MGKCHIIWNNDSNDYFFTSPTVTKKVNEKVNTDAGYTSEEFDLYAIGDKRVAF